MTFLEENAIALAALAVSIIVAGLQFEDRWRRRHRVTVSVQPFSYSEPEGGKQVRTIRIVAVTVRNIGRPVTVEDVFFDQLSGPEGVSWATAEGVPGWTDTAKAPRAGLRPGQVLGDGESCTWAFAALSNAPSAMRSITAEAVVTLSTGQVVRSSPFWHAPHPPDGES